jgi:hypothetical protein
VYAWTLHCISGVYACRGHNGEQLVWRRRALSAMEAINGMQHPSSKRIRRELVQIYTMMGMPEEAQEMERGLVEGAVEAGAGAGLASSDDEEDDGEDDT